MEESKAGMSETPIARRVVERMRREVRSKVVNLAAFREGNARAEALLSSVVAAEDLAKTHPTHAMYVYVQNQMSVMAEQLLELTEMKAFAKLVELAEGEYMPSWPPMSPVTKSFFWRWALFDASVNAHRETIASVTLRVGAEFGVHPKMLTLMRMLKDSRMGIYRVEGVSESHVQLRDLMTGRQCSAVGESGYPGRWARSGIRGCSRRCCPNCPITWYSHPRMCSSLPMRSAGRSTSIEPRRKSPTDLALRRSNDTSSGGRRVVTGRNLCSRVTSITNLGQSFSRDCRTFPQAGLIHGSM